MTDSNNWTLLPFLRDSAGVDTMVSTPAGSALTSPASA